MAIGNVGDLKLLSETKARLRPQAFGLQTGLEINADWPQEP